MHGDLDIFDRGHRLEQTDVLKGTRQPQLGHTIRLHPGDVGHLAVDIELDGSLAWLIDARQQVEEGRLAGAVGSDQSDQLPFADLHADIGNGAKSAEVLRQSLYT